MSKVVVKPLIDSSELDETMAKVEKLNKLLGEANSLLKELASREVEIIASIENQGVEQYGTERNEFKKIIY